MQAKNNFYTSPHSVFDSLLLWLLCAFCPLCNSLNLGFGMLEILLVKLLILKLCSDALQPD